MDSLLDAITRLLATFPREWDGKAAILEMQRVGYPHWRQSEWIGFYFQYLCETRLPESGMTIPGTKYGRAEFDGKAIIDWDFKAHPIVNKDGKQSDDLIVNDMEATIATISANGNTGLIVAQGRATFDNGDPAFRQWHSLLKGGLSAYSIANVARGARQRAYKVSFSLTRIDLYIIDAEDVARQSSFQKGMRNSNGKPRREKLKVNLATLTPVKSVIF